MIINIHCVDIFLYLRPTNTVIRQAALVKESETKGDKAALAYVYV